MKRDNNRPNLTAREASRRRRILSRMEHTTSVQRYHDDDRIVLTRKGLDAVERVVRQRERAAEVAREVYGSGAWE